LRIHLNYPPTLLADKKQLNEVGDEWRQKAPPDSTPPT
jgi:hypothetical protein